MNTKNGSSKSSSKPRSSSVPRRNLGKIHRLSAQSRLEDVGSGHSCTDRITELVSCHRGYGSVALYAVFSIFILAFLYVIWKILSAHTSRSGHARRPGISNSTSATKITPTAHSVVGNVTALKWMKQGGGGGTLRHSVHHARPQHKVSGQRRLKIHLNGDDKRDRIQPMSSNNAPPWLTISRSTAGPPTRRPTSREGTSKTYPDPSNWITRPEIREPTVATSDPIPAGYNYFSRPNREYDFLKEGDITAGIGRPMEGTSDYDDSREREWPTWEAKRMQVPRVSNEDRPYRYYKKQNVQDGYNLNYHADTGYRENTYNPRPRLTSVFDGDSEGASNKMRTEHREKKFPSQPEQRHYYRYLTRHRKHHRRQHDRMYERNSFRNNIDDKDREQRESSRYSNVGHHQHHYHQHKPHVRFHRLIHHKKVEHRHENMNRARQAHRHRHNYYGNENNEEHLTASKGRYRKVRKSHPREIVRYHTRRPVQKETWTEDDPDRGRPVHRRTEHVYGRRHRTHGPGHHSQRVPKHTIPKRSKPTHRSVQPRRQRPHVHVLGYRRYLQYRHHHSFQEESRGKWRTSRHHIRTCKTLHTFSTTGTVKLSRTKYKSKFLYTLLVCKPVRFRIHQHRRKFEVRRAQLCHNKWYVTRGLIHVKKATESPALPTYTVRLCTRSYVRKMILKLRVGEAKHKSTRNRQGARKLTAKHRRHKIKRMKHNHRKTRKKKKTAAHKHLKKKEELAEKHKKSKRLRHKAGKNRHAHLLSRKTKKTRKKSKVRKKDLIHHNPPERKNKKLNATKGSSGNDFFVKLLQVLKLAKQNQTRHGDIVGSLEQAVERIIQIHRNGTHHRNATKKVGESSKITDKNRGGHVNSKSLSILQANSTNISKDFIQKVLAQVLPYVVQSVKSNGSSELQPRIATAQPTTKLKPTTKTKQADSPRPTTKVKQTDSPKPTTKTKTSTVTPSGGDMEAVLKSLLPLLLKKAHQTRATQATTTKPPTTKTTVATTQPKAKKLTELLASLGLDSLDLGSLGKLNTKTTKPTQNVNKVPDTTRSTSTAAPTTRSPWAPEVPVTPPPPPLPKPLLPPPPLPPPPPPPPPPSLPKPHPFSPARPVPPPSVLNPNLNVGTNPDPFTKHILCFGDSLTSGFYNHGKNFHPYSIRLNQLLNANARGVHYHVDTSGDVREMVHGSMTKRLPMVLGNTSRVDWAVILGGTNDVAHVKNFGDDDSFMNQLINVWRPKIVQDILSLHQTAYRFGARTLLLTIPESAYEAWPSFKTLWVMRTAINQDLREFARRSQGKTVLCDLAIKLPRHTLPAKAQALLWNDHLHPTPYGYDRMADIVYQCMKPYLRK